MMKLLVQEQNLHFTCKLDGDGDSDDNGDRLDS